MTKQKTIEDVAEQIAEDASLRQELERERRAHADLLERLVERLSPRSLDERMAAVQLELEDVPRQGHAEVTMKSGGSYSYDYITESDLMKGVRPLLAKHGIAVYYSDEILSREQGNATVRVWVTFAANGEERTISGDGFATDYGDKASSKAKTTAVRYLLWKTFLQPSDEDPEQENVSEQDAARAAARTSPRQAPQATRGKLVERIGHLALELDEIQGHAAGATLGRLPGLARDAFDLADPYPNGATDQQLVAIGTQVAEFVSSERARKESDPDAYAPAELEIRGSQA